MSGMSSTDTDKVLSMVLRDKIDIFGRMPVGFDVSEFDLLPTDQVYTQIADPDKAFGLPVEDARLDMFQSTDEGTADDEFPILSEALRGIGDPKPRLMRVDTPETYSSFMSDRAVDEILRRIDDLRDALLAHEGDPLAHPHVHEDGHMLARQKADILGAAEAVAKISSAEDADEAAQAMPAVAIDIPEFARNKVRCWRDGDRVVCSLKFLSKSGQRRVATMSATPCFDEEEVVGAALRRGVDPVYVLGALPDMAASACGQRLVKELSRAALACAEREDVCGMSPADEPLLLVARATDAPTAAMMHLEERAQAGDPAALRERARVEKAASSRLGRKVIAPVVLKARAKLAKKAKKPTFAERYGNMIALMA